MTRLAIEFSRQLKYKSNLNNMIKECKWAPTDVCLNEDKCRPNKKLAVGYIFNRNNQCGCSEESLGFRCGRKYCTSNQEACDAFNKNLLSGNKYTKVNKCKK